MNDIVALDTWSYAIAQWEKEARRAMESGAGAGARADYYQIRALEMEQAHEMFMDAIQFGIIQQPIQTIILAQYIRVDEERSTDACLRAWIHDSNRRRSSGSKF